MKTYKIDYCNGFMMTIEAEDITTVIEKAIENVAYTQCDIKIRNEQYETIAFSRWYGVQPEEWDQPILTIGGGFYDGFIDSTTEEYI